MEKTKTPLAAAMEEVLYAPGTLTTAQQYEKVIAELVRRLPNREITLEPHMFAEPDSLVSEVDASGCLHLRAAKGTLNVG